MNTDTHTEKALLEFSTKDEQTSSASRSLIRGYHLRPRCGVDKTLSQSARSPLLKVESLTLSGGGRLAHVLIFAVDNRSISGRNSPWKRVTVGNRSDRSTGGPEAGMGFKPVFLFFICWPQAKKVLNLRHT